MASTPASDTSAADQAGGGPSSHDIRARLAELSIELPRLGPAKYSYEPTTRGGDVLYVAGQISRTPDGELLGGRLGDDAGVEEGAAAARVSALNLLGRIEDAVGLESVERVLKMNVWISSTPDATGVPEAADGASRLLIDVLGDAGRHARTSLPAVGLPQGALVELDATVQIRS